MSEIAISQVKNFHLGKFREMASLSESYRCIYGGFRSRLRKINLILFVETPWAFLNAILSFHKTNSFIFIPAKLGISLSFVKL